MKKYEVEIHFVNGDKVQARVDARNKKDALREIGEYMSEHFRELI